MVVLRPGGPEAWTTRRFRQFVAQIVTGGNAEADVLVRTGCCLLLKSSGSWVQDV